MSTYTQLTMIGRYHLYLRKKSGSFIREITRGINRSPITISRELKRNTGDKGYRYKQAHSKAEQRHQDKPKAIKLTEEIKSYIKNAMRT